jgi:3-hydroxyacyl-[acyl-carrier-protein] dehydratase
MQSLLDIGADHPTFAGHFPRFPVLPGAVLLDEMLQVIARARGIDLTQWQLASAKFLDVVRPRDSLLLEHDAPAPGLIRFTIRSENRKVASGTLSMATREASR